MKLEHEKIRIVLSMSWEWFLVMQLLESGRYNIFHKYALCK